MNHNQAVQKHFNRWLIASVVLCAISWWPMLIVFLLYISGNAVWAHGDPWMLMGSFATPVIPAFICFKEGTNSIVYLPPLYIELITKSSYREYKKPSRYKVYSYKKCEERAESRAYGSMFSD